MQTPTQEALGGAERFARALPVPRFVAGGIELLDALYAERFEGGGDHAARTANHGGASIVNDTFQLHPERWSDDPEDDDPNFSHTSSGFAVSWYKHIGRGAEMNRDITVSEWAGILQDCIAAISGAPSPYRVLITGSREYGASLYERKKKLRSTWKTDPSPQRDAMLQALRDARGRANGRPLLIVQGDAAGADHLAATLAQTAGVDVEDWPALWRREDGSMDRGYDRAEALRMRSVYDPNAVGFIRTAGPDRNQAMVDAGADECLAFLAVGAGNRGTRHCMSAASKAGIPVYVTEA